MHRRAGPLAVWTLVSLAAFALVSAPIAAGAQSYESVGIRAQGMGGAFVAVADDATASWWNPAGLAHGAYFSAILEVGTSRQPDNERDAGGLPVPAGRDRVRGFAVSFPALALSYYRVSVSQVQPLASTAGAPGDRQDVGAGEVHLRSLVVNQFGATVGQSIGDHLVLGSTLKLVHGSRVVAVAKSGAASLDDADALQDAPGSAFENTGDTRADLDLGAMVVFESARFGLTVKNVGQPTFGTGDDRVEMKRQVRAGAAVVGGRVSVSADVDLTRTPGVEGDERHVAVGVEAWTHGRRLGLRGGVNANTVGASRRSLSGGISLALRSAVYLDAQRTVGSSRARHGWGVGLRTTF